MKAHFVLALAAASALTACGQGPSAPQPSRVFGKFDMAPDFLKVDKVGFNDGDFKADGANDTAFTVELTAPVRALFVVVTTADGAPTGDFQADTLVGQEPEPKELTGKGVTQGKSTVGIAVFEGDKLLSKPDGSLPALSAGPHALVIYTSAPAGLKFGTYFRLYAELPDKSFAVGPIIKY